MIKMLVTALLSLILLGCSAQEPEPVATQTVFVEKARPVSEFSGDYTSAERQEFVANMRSSGLVDGLNDSDIISLGLTVCYALRDNNADYEITGLELSMQYDWSYYQTGYIIGAAVTSICDMYEDEVKEQVEE